MGRVAGKVALVSGAARGQGRSHARMLAAEGADIIAVDLCEDIETNSYPLARPEDLDETARLIEKEGQRAYTAIADVRDRVGSAAAIDAGVGEFGRLDIVVANAGIAPLTAGLPMQAWIDAVDVDLIGVMNLRARQHPAPRCGRIHHRNRIIGRVPGLDAGTQHERRRRSRGWRVTHSPNRLSHTTSTTCLFSWHRVHPGQRRASDQCEHRHAAQHRHVPAVPSDLADPTREDAELTFPVLNAMPIAYVEPEDISEAVVYFASDASRYVTGQQLKIDAGGYVKAMTWTLR